MKSKIWLIEKSKLQEILNTSSSIVEVLKIIGYSGYNGNYKTLLKRIKSDNLSLDLLKKNGKNQRSLFCKKQLGKTIPDNLIFCKNSKYISNSGIKKRLIKLNFKYECAVCFNSGIWNNNRLSLQLDHINGINNDNRLENLRLLCPNCHSQTDTFSGKANKKILKCPICNSDNYKGYGKMCKKCYGKEMQNGGKIANKKFVKWPPLKEVVDLCKKLPRTEVAKLIGCSDNAIKKFLLRNNSL